MLNDNTSRIRSESRTFLLRHIMKLHNIVKELVVVYRVSASAGKVIPNGINKLFLGKNSHISERACKYAGLFLRHFFKSRAACGNAVRGGGVYVVNVRSCACHNNNVFACGGVNPVRLGFQLVKACAVACYDYFKIRHLFYQPRSKA